jgi:hypothetical protein
MSAIAESTMGHAVSGDPRLAVQLLLERGETTRNAKLIELAALVTQRHETRIDASAELLARAQALKQRYCQAGVPTIGAQRSGRSAGGLSLLARTGVRTSCPAAMVAAREADSETASDRTRRDRD